MRSGRTGRGQLRVRLGQPIDHVSWLAPAAFRRSHTMEGLASSRLLLLISGRHCPASTGLHSPPRLGQISLVFLSVWHAEMDARFFVCSEQPKTSCIQQQPQPQMWAATQVSTGTLMQTYQ